MQFCTPAVVYTRYFACVKKATARKVKVAKMLAMLIIWCKILKKITANYNIFEKMNLVKGL